METASYTKPSDGQMAELKKKKRSFVNDVGFFFLEKDKEIKMKKEKKKNLHGGWERFTAARPEKWITA